MSDNKPIATDCYDLVQKSVSSHMKPFIHVSMKEHEETRKKIEDVERLIIKLADNRVHSVVNSVLITFLFIGMIILFSGC